MRFWDSSALTPLLIEHPRSGRLRELCVADPSVAVWWSAEVECVSAVSRLERAGNLAGEQVAQALANLGELREGWHEVQPSNALRETARRLLRVHPLRAADALQLAAALTLAGHRPSRLEFVCLDDRLTAAARREGFRLPVEEE